MASRRVNTVEPFPERLASNGIGAEPQRKAVKPCPGRWDMRT
jgi:hypothetical protein